MAIQVQAKQLSTQEKEELGDLMQHEGFKSFLKLVDIVAESQYLSMLRLNVVTEVDERQFIKARHEAQGASKFIAALNAQLSKIRVASSSAVKQKSK